MIPSPPSHCRMLRHSNNPGGAESKPVITVAPVVVIPDIASKNASVNDNRKSEIMNGRQANAGSTTQDNVVSKKAWRRVNVTSPVRVVMTVAAPINRVKAAETAKAAQSGFPL